MIAVLMVLASAVFGAADQYLGSLSAHPWAAEVSLLSAPWILIPFVAGCTQAAGSRAALLGWAVTLAALVGYGVMTLSPIEGADLTMHTTIAFLRSEAPVFVGGAVTGPLFGWLGRRWKTDRAVAGPVIVAAAFCFEPVVHAVVQRGGFQPSAVPVAEVVIGVVAAASAVLLRRRARTAAPQ